MGSCSRKGGALEGERKTSHNHVGRQVGQGSWLRALSAEPGPAYDKPHTYARVDHQGPPCYVSSMYRPRSAGGRFFSISKVQGPLAIVHPIVTNITVFLYISYKEHTVPLA